MTASQTLGALLFLVVVVLLGILVTTMSAPVPHAEHFHSGALAATTLDTGTLDRCPKCRWVCPPSECTKKCRPVCRKPACRIRCKPLSPARCTTHCDPPTCRVVCSGGDRCIEGRCPKCTVQCDAPRCEVRCCRPRPQCTTICEPADCTWSCSTPRDCPAPKCTLQCDDDEGGARS